MKVQNKKPDNKDYTFKSFTVTFGVTVLLACTILIPGFNIEGTTIKRANIFSDVMKLDEFTDDLSDHIIDTSFYEDAPAGLLALLDKRVAGVAAEESAADTLTANQIKRYALPVITDDTLIKIEDYSPDGQMMAKFYHDLALESAERTVRIAVFGDSFIEADIITVDMREQLQDYFGGSGVGFVPFSTPLAKYRSSVKHTFNGWETYNIINKKSVPDEYKSRFSVSGMISIPYEGATVRYEGSAFRRNLASVPKATLLFKNRGSSTVSVSVDNGEPRIFNPETSDNLNHITIENDMERLDIKLSGVKGFIGYGAVLEDSIGVSVHNYSVRSNSGTALIGTNAELNTQINDLMRYDLIVIQYGLNAMSADVLKYDHYGKQLVRIIEFVKMCFPQSAIVVMSVGDRSTLKDGVRMTMPAALAMLKTQREAARETGVAFWNTYEAMGAENSMIRFVQKGWAAKDYTHMGFAGGQYIATRFVDYLKAAAESVKEIYNDDPYFGGERLPERDSQMIYLSNSKIRDMLNKPKTDNGKNPGTEDGNGNNEDAGAENNREADAENGRQNGNKVMKLEFA